MNYLPIAEKIFYGLQGEGARMGHPSVFLRLGGCNLTCKGFNCKVKSPETGNIITGCDTIFAANKLHFENTWRYFNYSSDIIEQVNSVLPKELLYNLDKADIVITGGEPMIHYWNPILIELIQFYISRGHRVYYETNGTISCNFKEYPIYKKVHFSISVKMKTSGEPKSKRWKPSVVNSYISNTKNSYFKFVLSEKTLSLDSEEIYDLLKLIPSYATVFCMPMGATEDELKMNAKAVYEFALKNGFRFSDRIHIRIYNDKQGV